MFGFLISFAIFSVRSSLIHFIGFVLMIAYFIIDNSLLSIGFTKFSFSYHKRCYNYDYIYYIFGFIILHLYIVTFDDSKLSYILFCLYTNFLLCIESYFFGIVCGMNEILNKREFIVNYIYWETFFTSIKIINFENMFDMYKIVIQIISTYLIGFIIFINDHVVSFVDKGIEIEYNNKEDKGIIRKLPRGDVVIPSVVTVHGYSFNVDEIMVFRKNLSYLISIPNKSKLTFEEPSNVKVIGPLILSRYELTKLPTSVKLITRPIFDYTLYLEISLLIKVDDKSKYFHNESSLFIQNYPLSIIYCNKHATRALIRKGIVEIGNSAFQFCKKIKSIHFPASVLRIEDDAFNFCYKLRYVTFDPSSRLKYIGNDSFNYTRIKNIIIPSSIEEIGNEVFNSNEIKLIKISSRCSCLRKLGEKFIDCKFDPKQINVDTCMLNDGIKLVNFPVHLIQNLI